MKSAHTLLFGLVVVLFFVPFMTDDSDAAESIAFSDEGVNYYVPDTSRNLAYVGDGSSLDGNGLVDKTVSSVYLYDTVMYGDRLYSVSGILRNAFSNTQLESVSMAEGIQSVGPYAFFRCTSLKEVSFGGALNSIGDGAFSECVSLTEIVIADSLNSISDYAFSDCTSLTSVTVGSGSYSISQSAFLRCSSLHQVYVSNQSTLALYLDIGTPSERAFCCAVRLGTGTLNVSGNSYTEVVTDEVPFVHVTVGTSEEGTGAVTGNGFYSSGEEVTVRAVPAKGYAFIGWSDGSDDPVVRKITPISDMELQAVFGKVFTDGTYNYTDLRDGTVMLGTGSGQANAVADISKVTSDLPETVDHDGMSRSVRVIADDAFNGCLALSDGLSLPSATERIGERAFYGCSSLQGTVVLPVSLKEIGERAFYGCYGLTGLNWEMSSVPSIGIAAFALGSDSHRTSCNVQSSFSNGFLNLYRTGYTDFRYNSYAPVYYVTLYAGENGSVSGTGSFFGGSSVMISAIADKGYELASWSDGGTESERMIMPTSDVVLTATFRDYSSLPPSSGSPYSGAILVLVAVVILLVAVAVCVVMARWE